MATVFAVGKAPLLLLYMVLGCESKHESTASGGSTWLHLATLSIVCEGVAVDAKVVPSRRSSTIVFGALPIKHHVCMTNMVLHSY